MLRGNCKLGNTFVSNRIATHETEKGQKEDQKDWVLERGSLVARCGITALNTELAPPQPTLKYVVWDNSSGSGMKFV